MCEHFFHLGISSASIAPVNVSAVEGESVRFECLVTATPSSAIEWENNGQSISTDDSHRYVCFDYAKPEISHSARIDSNPVYLEPIPFQPSAIQLRVQLNHFSDKLSRSDSLKRN